MTANYRFEKRYYGLTDKPIKIQKSIFYNLIKLENTYCFLDAILLVSKGSVNEYLKHEFNCLKLFDQENLRINQPECPCIKIENDLIGYHLGPPNTKRPPTILSSSLLLSTENGDSPGLLVGCQSS